MARSSLRPCTQPGCGRLVPSGRCPDHQASKDRVDAQYRAKRLEARYGKPAERGYDHAWRKVKDGLLAANPTCACGRPTRMVHHIVALKDGGERLDPANLEPLCWECHRVRHAH